MTMNIHPKTTHLTTPPTTPRPTPIHPTSTTRPSRRSQIFLELFLHDGGYDPTDFDNLHSGSLLLMFGDGDMYNQYYCTPYPSGSDNNDETHSRTSSASVLNFQSPAWHNEPLPPQHNSPSPPLLTMPNPPIIVNAPTDQDTSDLSPSLHIVLAIPISGGGAVLNIASTHFTRYMIILCDPITVLLLDVTSSYRLSHFSAHVHTPIIIPNNACAAHQLHERYEEVLN
ncbi:hypothetical protein Hypma_005898 [Hypsizygus marmoreus]|uniref:Uncharacterized protein n=1 Tax=Hypsizygus marmoreus TaxID=39966 RepID=A0A369KDX2_HYPMA|nr:hypothetical protein Hypma_005898 [Hypsizygus marmoreus]